MKGMLQLTEPERRTIVALAEVQPATFRSLAIAAGYTSTNGVYGVVNRLAAKGLIPRLKRRWGSINDSRSLRLADGIVVTRSGEVGQWIPLA